MSGEENYRNPDRRNEDGFGPDGISRSRAAGVTVLIAALLLFQIGTFIYERCFRPAPAGRESAAERLGKPPERRLPAERFLFDPNTISQEDLCRLGLTARQAQSIARYRDKGGRYRRPEDFARMYVIGDSLYRELEPWIRIGIHSVADGPAGVSASSTSWDLSDSPGMSGLSGPSGSSGTSGSSGSSDASGYPGFPSGYSLRAASPFGGPERLQESGPVLPPGKPAGKSSGNRSERDSGVQAGVQSGPFSGNRTGELLKKSGGLPSGNPGTFPGSRSVTGGRSGPGTQPGTQPETELQSELQSELRFKTRSKIQSEPRSESELRSELRTESRSTHRSALRSGGRPAAAGISPAPVDLNTADSAALTSLRGIGPYYARKILAYRERLGGFSDPEQLLEIPGIDSARLALFRARLVLNPDSVPRFRLDTAGWDFMRRHPYIGPYAARGILLFRRMRGAEACTLDSLQKEQILTPGQAARLRRCVREKTDGVFGKN